ncbi:hypothetical protein ACFSJS_21090 [Streptomyces desertarenae]|uniref:LigA protein n=1 Tax=Streptomyces desertarenae TaxID=2666184 RepID=A0ABW4PQ51_9ACTN
MTSQTRARGGTGRVLAAHLAVLALVGTAFAHVQLHAVFLALLFSEGAAVAVVPVAAVAGGTALFTAVGGLFRQFAPITGRASGRWVWGAGVYTLGTAGVLAVLVVDRQGPGLGPGADVLLHPFGGLCHALGAVPFLAGARVRLAALAGAAVLAGGWAYGVWESSRPLSPEEWLAANRVDRALLRVGDPPPGYALDVAHASATAFGAGYTRGDTRALRLSVERPGTGAGPRVDARGCPVPLGGTAVRCTDDGGGRLLVAYADGHERRELRLLRDGLLHVVALEGPRSDPAAARHVLSTLRPATGAELAPLAERSAPR